MVYPDSWLICFFQTTKLNIQPYILYICKSKGQLKGGRICIHSAWWLQILRHFAPQNDRKIG